MFNIIMFNIIMHKLFCIFLIVLFIVLINLNYKNTINESFKNDIPFYYINLDRSKRRNNHMIDMFKKYNITNFYK